MGEIANETLKSKSSASGSASYAGKQFLSFEEAINALRGGQAVRNIKTRPQLPEGQQEGPVTSYLSIARLTKNQVIVLVHPGGGIQAMTFGSEDILNGQYEAVEPA